MLVGAAILLLLFVIEPLSGKNFDARLNAMVMGALFAFPPLVVYLWVPWIIDRFDPEPWWCLALALFWGAIASAGFAGWINTEVIEYTRQEVGGGKDAEAIAEVVGSCISAPLVEEL